MKSFWFYLSLFAWVNLFSLSPASGQLKKAPSWIKEVPISGDTFYGLGIVNTKDSDQYRTLARKMALREIAEKIYVSINAQSELTTRYENDELDLLLDESIELEAQNFLSGHQKVDDWKDKKSGNYYVLYALDRNTYLENRYQYFSGVDELVRLMRVEADESMIKGDLARSVRKLSDVVVLLDEELSRLIEPEFEIQLQKLRLSAIQSLESGLARVSIQTQDEYEFAIDSYQPLVIRDFVVDKVTGRPLNQVNSKIKVLNGDVFKYALNHNSKTNELVIYGFFPERQTAVIQLMVEIPMSEAIVRSELHTSNRLISSPITLKFKPYGINYETVSEGEKNLLENYLRMVTTDLGLDEGRNDGLYSIRIISEQEVRTQRRGLYQGRYAAAVTVTRSVDEKRLFTYDLPLETIYSTNMDKAQTNAFRKALDYNDQFLVSFVTFLCSYHVD